MHHSVLDKNCVVIDGVLCPAQIEQDNDGEEAYLQSLSEALPLHATSRRIGYLVTTRPEKYRKLTEAWLERHDIRYGELIMADFPSRDEEQLLAENSRFKADFYRKSDANLFIENDYEQAQMIAKMSGKPVLCVEAHHISRPDSLSPAALRQQMRNLPIRLKQRRHETGRQLKGLARSMLGEAGYLTLKKLVRPKPKG